MRRSDEDNYLEFFYEKKGDKKNKNKMKTKNNKSNLIPKSTFNYR